MPAAPDRNQSRPSEVLNVFVSPQGLTDADFETIQATVMETKRGSWFLAEFAKRRYSEGVVRMLAAMDRLEALALCREVDRTRQRLQAEKSAALVSQLIELLKGLQPQAVAQARPRTMAECSAESLGLKPRGLGQRFAALVELDQKDLKDSGGWAPL